MAIRKTFDVQGMKFRLKPTSRNNVERLRSHFENPTDEILAQDDYEQWVEVLRVIAEPVGDASFDKIDVGEFDTKIAEQALVDFMPTLMLTLSGLVGSS
jgi:hypothetical protein